MPKQLTETEKAAYWSVILETVTRLEQAGIPYHIDSSTTLFVHGVDVFIKDVDINIPFDRLKDVHALMQDYNPEPIVQGSPWHDFHVHPRGVDVHFLTTEKMTAPAMASNTDRVQVTYQGTTFWSLSVDWCRRHMHDDDRAPAVDRYLAERDNLQA